MVNPNKKINIFYNGVSVSVFLMAFYQAYCVLSKIFILRRSKECLAVLISNVCVWKPFRFNNVIESTKQNNKNERMNYFNFVFFFCIDNYNISILSLYEMYIHGIRVFRYAIRKEVSFSRCYH